LRAARSVAEVSFRFSETSDSAAGPAERDAASATISAESVDHLRHRADRGLTVTAIAESQTDGVVATGAYQPVGDTAELLAVATLPQARRRGIARALTAYLAHHAFDAGVNLMILSAQNDNVARVYERVGFSRVGNTRAAEPGQ
jgi:ribosomal protein S18 acetylase RimI-like enzyme